VREKVSEGAYFTLLHAVHGSSCIWLLLW